MAKSIMIIARTAAIPFIAEELTEHGYCSYCCDSIQLALDTVYQLNPDLILVVDHFIEGFRDPLEIYFYTRQPLNRAIPIVFVSFCHLPETLVQLDLDCFTLLEMEIAMNTIYQLLAD